MKQPDTSALRERLAGYTSEQDIQELDGLTEKISGQINGLHNLLDEIKDLREEMHGIHESLRHTLQRERTAFNALTAAKDSAENIVDGICNAIVKAEQHTVIKAEVSTAELEKINQWSAAHIKAEEEIWTRQSKKLARYLSKNEGIWLSSRWLIFMIIVQAVSYFVCANARSPRHCRRLLFSLFNNRRYNCYTSVIFRFGRNFSRPTVYYFFKVGNSPVSS